MTKEEKALEYFNEAIKANDSGNYEAARNNFEKVIELNPNEKSAYLNLGFLLTKYLSDYKKAKLIYEKAIKKDFNDAELFYMFAFLLGEYFQEYRRARIYYEKAIEINPNYAEETYITDLEIKKVRHINELKINLSETEKKHLLFTGKNGSGKTSVLKEAKEYLEEILEMPVNEEFIKKAKEQFLSKDNYNFKFNITSNLLTLRLKYETGNFIAAYFPARRKLSLKAIEGRPDNIQIPLTAKISERLNDNLIDYYWNIKTQALLALEKEDFEKKKRLDKLINAFIDKFKIIDSRIQNVEFTAEKGKYNIEFIPEAPYEKFDFSSLADGYASIFDFISEIILRMSNRTDDVFNLEGIVLIDEPETHLHIEMQRQVLPLLSQFFPNVQFVVATHSPFVINSISNSVIYDLETGVRNEDFSEIPAEYLNKYYFSFSKEYVKQIENKVVEFERLTDLLKEKNINEEDRNTLAELEIELDEVTPYISKKDFIRFKENQKYIYE